MSAAKDMIGQVSITELKELFAQHLRDADRLKKSDGCPTGLEAFDRFLFWGGIPKGALSLFSGRLGSGATSLWLEAAANVVRQGRWVAWINGPVPLSPISLHHKGVDLSRLIAIEAPPDEKKLLWLLQELLSSTLFDLIGCDLGSFRLREHQVRKLQAHARQTNTAVTFLSQSKPFRGSVASVFSLMVSFERRRLLIERASHRPTPHAFPRSVNYARFTLHTGDRIGLGANLLDRSSTERAHAGPSSLLETDPERGFRTTPESEPGARRC